MIVFKILVLVLISLEAHSKRETIDLKQTTTKYNLFTTQTEETELMPGNESFGFFFRKDKGSQGICRIRTQLLCDHGMEFYSKIKNKEVVLIAKSKMYSATSDHDGVLDFLIRCDESWSKAKATLSFGKYQSEFVASKAPKKHKVSDGKCK